MRTQSTSIVAGWLALFLSLSLAFGAPAYAQHHGEGGGMWHGRHLKVMLDAVKATPDQRQKIETISQGLAPEMKAQHDAHRALMSKSVQLLAAPTIDEAAIEQNRQQMLAQHEQMSKRMSAAFIEMAKVLTPEQRAQLAAHMQSRMQQRQDRMKDGMNHRRQLGGAAPAAAASEAVR